MFNSEHYIPILKWKRAEQGALKALSEVDKKHVTPLIQFVMPKNNPQEKLENVVTKFEEKLSQLPEELIEVWGTQPVFIDVSLLFTTPLKVKSLDVISRGGNRLGGVFIPVIHITDDNDIKEAVFLLAKETKSGLCLRLVCSDFSDLKQLNKDVVELISTSGLNEKDIDLLIDIKETEDNTSKYMQYLSLSQSIVNLTKWRTLIFASGSFPKDLSECKHDEENLLPRTDWKSWKENIIGKKLLRKPSFADYTIQFPIYKEDSQFFPPTSSIKYTLENDWLIMKGKRQKFEMYLASASLLVKDKRFYGENFSYGDKYIAEKAKHFDVFIKNPAIKGTGSTGTWLMAGINHHLTLVARQVSTLI